MWVEACLRQEKEGEMVVVVEGRVGRTRTLHLLSHRIDSFPKEFHHDTDSHFVTAYKNYTSNH